MTKELPKYDTLDLNNVYAFNIKDEEIHISDAVSGRKGYYCLGCKREMQAVKSNLVGRISYFRHDAKAVQGQAKCTYSDETYRHKVAKQILLRLKKIKVPIVYKYPSLGKDGKVYLLAESKIIEAHSVGIERSFYEDDDGQILCMKGDNLPNEKHLLIRPDVTFFDANEKPILFIEIVVTHKITDEKRVKLKRLGIDTIQIRIPKDSLEEIEKSFFTTQNTKWIYNDEEQRTEYISIPEGSTEGVPSIDEEQRKLFAESYKCRSAQINNLIRTIKRCLGSQLYRGIEGGFESEISRVEDNTEKFGEQWRGLQNKIKLGISEQYRERREKFDGEQAEFLVEEGDFQRHYKDLEARYFAKKQVLESQIRSAIAGVGGNGESFETRRRNIEREISGVDGSIRNGNRRIEQIKADRRELESKLRTNFESAEKHEIEEMEGIQSLLNGLPEKFEKLEIGVRTEFEYFEATERGEIANCEKFETNFDNLVEQGRGELDGRFKDLREGILKSIKTRDAGGDSEFARKLKDLIKNGALLVHLEEAQINFRRYKRAWECFKSGAYQKWN